VRVPAILISPWIKAGTVVDRVFDHASIPSTITKFFLGSYPNVSAREANAGVFIEPNNGSGNMANNLLSLDVMRTPDQCPIFKIR
jgi:phospholipase C